MKEGTRELTLMEKLKAEVRICPVCELEIRNPFIERCPRCYGKMPRPELECNGCIHRLSCPALGFEVVHPETENSNGHLKS